MNLVDKIKKITSKKLLTLLSVAIISFGIIGGCGTNEADPDRSDSDEIVNNFLISILDNGVFANACNIGDIQIDSEALPPNTFIDIDFVPGFNSVGACILDSSVVLDSNGRAFLDFIADYIVGVGSTGSFRILLNATTPDGQFITQFADIVLSGIGIIPPTGDGEDSTFALDITIDEMGMDEIPFQPLQFTTVGIKPGTVVDFTVSNPPLGDVDVNPAIVSGNVNSGSFTTTYFPNPVAGTQLLTATITLNTPQEILDQCDAVSSSVQISVIVTFIQSLTVNTGDDGGMDGM